MEKIAIIHFQPLELYPPVTNFLNCFTAQKEAPVAKVYTTAPIADDPLFYNPNVDIIRYGKLYARKNKIFRAFQYFYFYVCTFLQLIKFKPGVIIYYETLSFLPVCGYIVLRQIARKKVRVFCHYHEYTSPSEYKNGMYLNRFQHYLERKLYYKMMWISHTNVERVKLFAEDVYPLKLNNVLHSLPNYPPKNWLNTADDTPSRLSLKIVYVGALGMETMYIKEFAEWVENQRGDVIWHIYSQQDGKILLDYLSTIKSKYICFKGKVNYYSLPAVLKDYDVGVILYNGHIPNYIYNAPNKLFEYYVCGLDVWFPKELKSSLQYATNGVFPRIISLDFNNLRQFDFTKASDRSGLLKIVPNYFCENAVDELLSEIVKR